MPAAEHVVIVLTIGQYTATGTRTWIGSTDKKCWASILVPDDITALTVNVLRHTGTVTLFSCTSAADC